MEWRNILVRYMKWSDNKPLNTHIAERLKRDFETVGEVFDADQYDPGMLMRIPGIGKLSVTAIRETLQQIRGVKMPTLPAYMAPPISDDEKDVMPPVIIPAQPGWFAKRTDDGSQYQPVIAWAVFSVARVGDAPRAIGALSGKLDAGWTLEYNARPNPWHE